MWIQFFRLCMVTEQKVVVTPPILFGRGYVFDRPRRTVRVSRCVLGLPISRMHIPYGSFRLRVRENERSVTHYTHIGGAGTFATGKSVKRVYTIAMRVPGQHQELDIGHFDRGISSQVAKARAERVLGAIRHVTAFKRKDSN